MINEGQLGVMGTSDVLSPVCVDSLIKSSVIAVAAGEYHSAALSKNGLFHFPVKENTNSIQRQNIREKREE